MTQVPRAIANGLLAALPSPALERLTPHLQPVELRLGERLYEPGSKLTHAYFPADSIVSLLHTTRNGASAEIAVVGREGLVGVPLVMGGDTTPSEAVVQSSGWAFQMPAGVVRSELTRGEDLQHLALLYTQALMTQMGQTAACNRYHAIHQQLCRWLLLSLDRVEANELRMTQDRIANVLGVQRHGVSRAARRLSDAGLIEYSRGHIVVLDRPGLEAQVCECYRLVRTEYERLLPLSIARS